MSKAVAILVILAVVACLIRYWSWIIQTLEGGDVNDVSPEEGERRKDRLTSWL